MEDFVGDLVIKVVTHLQDSLDLDVESMSDRDLKIRFWCCWFEADRHKENNGVYEMSRERLEYVIDHEDDIIGQIREYATSRAFADLEESRG